MKKITPQKIFDKVTQHLLTQMRLSITNETPVNGDFEGCLYRSPDGLKCAVGCLIPDDAYNICFEGMSLQNVLENVSKTTDIDFVKHQYLLAKLQNIHDYHDPSTWAEQLQEFAKQHKLNFTKMLTA